jgi:hypothetical protein
MRASQFLNWVAISIFVLIFLVSCQMPITPVIEPSTPSIEDSLVWSQSQNTRWEYKTLSVIYSINSSSLFTNPECQINPLQPESPLSCMAEDKDSALLDQLNKLGQEGWELVSVSSPYSFVFLFVFKRPVQ